MLLPSISIISFFPKRDIRWMLLFHGSLAIFVVESSSRKREFPCYYSQSPSSHFLLIVFTSSRGSFSIPCVPSALIYDFDFESLVFLCFHFFTVFFPSIQCRILETDPEMEIIQGISILGFVFLGKDLRIFIEICLMKAPCHGLGDPRIQSLSHLVHEHSV